MLIKSIKLNNFKSYKDEIIFFKDGINLLWGDIGCGKTSVLQAIEFSLFGLGKDEGKLYLRKGASKGFVELVLFDNNFEVKIKRSLKKTKQGIRQEKCFLIINEDEEELLPSELDYRILNFLKIPKYKRQKNLAYRFITYTPQEELKKILEAREDTRLEIIRKAFSIEHYDVILKNLSFYLRGKREDKKILDVKISSLSEFEKKREEQISLILEKEELFNDFRDKKDLYKNKLDGYSEKQKIVREKKKKNDERLLSLKTKLNEKNVRLKVLEKNQEQILIFKEKIDNILGELSFEKFMSNFQSESRRVDVLGLEMKKLKDLKSKSEKFKKDFDELNDQIKLLSSQREEILENLKVFEHKQIEKKLAEFLEDINRFENDKRVVESLKQKRAKIDVEVKGLKSENQNKFFKIDNLRNLEFCEVCLQSVDDDHRDKIRKNFESEIFKNEKKIADLDLKLIEVNSELDRLSKGVESLDKLYSKRAKFENFLVLEKQSLDKLKDLDDNLKLKSKSLLKVERSFNFEELNLLEKKLEGFESDFVKFNQLQRDKSSLDLYFVEVEKLSKHNLSLKSKDEDCVGLDKELDDCMKYAHKVDEKQVLIQRNFEKLNEVYLINFKKYQELKFQIENSRSIVKECDVKIKELEFCREKLIFLQRLEVWLERDFSYLLRLLENFLFKKFYTEFNEIFEEVFRELIEDNNIDVRLDESFNPVVEQNGYDIEVGSLSGGERSSLALAYRFGLSKVIESNLIERFGLGFIILDEPTDGFSSEQVKRLSQILKDYNFEQVLIVSHDEKLTGISDNILRIEKVNHVSSILL